jgi:hypothetical protein
MRLIRDRVQQGIRPGAGQVRISNRVFLSLGALAEQFMVAGIADRCDHRSLTYAALHASRLSACRTCEACTKKLGRSC